MSVVSCQLSVVRCHIYLFTGQVLHDTCHLTPVTFDNSHSHRPYTCSLPNYAEFSRLVCIDKKPEKVQNPKNHRNSKNPKKPRDLKILAIYPLTRSLQPTQKHSYTDFFRFSKNQIFFQGATRSSIK